MSPPARGSQLDEISLKIGELAAYTHEHRHGVNNLSAKFDALALDIVKRVEALDTKMTLRIDEVVKALTSELAAANLRINALEAERDRQQGALSAWRWIAEKWPFAALGTILAAVIAWANGKLSL
jgi:hypothetical protein